VFSVTAQENIPERQIFTFRFYFRSAKVGYNGIQWGLQHMNRSGSTPEKGGEWKNE
jgi:hypothetical protein